MFKKTIYVLILTAALSFAGQVFAAELKIGLASEPSSMDPHYFILSPNVAAAAHVFERLATFDTDLQVVPQLATSWKTVADTTWEFNLRPNVTFHDGSPFTAEDVKFTIERVPNVKDARGYDRLVKMIDEVIIIDPLTIRFKTKKPAPLLPNNLANIFIISKKHGQGATSADFNSGKAMIGTGPYKFVEWKPKEHIIYKRNENYWGKKEAWDKLTFKPISSSTSRVSALLAGDVDVIDAVPPIDVKSLKNNKKFNVFEKTSYRLIYCTLDQNRDESPFVVDLKTGQILKNNPLKDIRVRKAISKAINRKAIAAKTMKGLAIPAGQLVPNGFFAVSPNLEVESYDPEGAKQLLKEAGWADGFGLTIHGPNNRYVNDSKILQAIGQMLTRIGIKTQVVAQPKNIFFPKSAKLKYSFTMLGWGNMGEPTPIMAHILHTFNKEKGYGRANRSRYSNKKFDELMETAMITVDREKQEKLLIEATDTVIGELGIIPLHFQVNVWATRKGLSYLGSSVEETYAMSVSAN